MNQTTTTCTSWSLVVLLYLAPRWFVVRHGSDLYWVGYSRMNLSWVTPRWTGVTRTIKCQRNNGMSACAETSKDFCSWPWCDYAYVLSNHTKRKWVWMWFLTVYCKHAPGFLRGKGHCMASRLLIETLVFGLYSMSDLVLLSEYMTLIRTHLLHFGIIAHLRRITGNITLVIVWD